jgi:hypothetical protein
VAANCTAAEGLTQSVMVAPRTLAIAQFTVTCQRSSSSSLRWTSIPLPSGVQAQRAVWASSVSDLFVVGYAEQPVLRYGIWHYDGTGWTEQVSRVDTSFSAIWGLSGTDVYAIGNRASRESPHPGAILHYDGSRWLDVAGPALDNSYTFFSGIWGTSANNIFLAGQAGSYGSGMVAHFDGQAWSVLPVSGFGSEVAFSDVWGASGSYPWVVGNERLQGCETCYDVTGVVARFDGQSWTRNYSASFTSFLAVWSSGSNDAWLVGRDESDLALLFHYDGTGWKGDPAVSYAELGLRDVWGSNSGDVYAVGPQVLLHFDGHAWSKVMDKGGDAVWGLSSDDVFVLRSNEVLHGSR